jgi:CHAT domain-containing protein
MHAYFDPGSPLSSGIVTADGVITARDLLQRRARAELVVVSACESGLSAPLAGTELAGLVHALLHGGARALVVSLWQVDDARTGALMRRLHALLQQGLDGPMALAEAMSWAGADRGLPAYYWAGFVFVGAWDAP